MKKILLSTALAALSLSAVSAEAFSGVIAGGRGSVLCFHNSTLPDLTKPTFGKDAADYGGFGINGGAGLVDLGYSYRFSNNFVAGLTVGAGYRHHTIKEARDTTTTDGSKKLGIDFVQSSITFEGRLRLGAAFGRFHVFINPGIALDYANPELTLKTKDDKNPEVSTKVTWATDKEPGWKERVSFVGGLNVEYAMTQTIALGGSVGFRYSFADVKLAGLTGESLTTVTAGNDTFGYKNPWGVEAGLHATVSF